MMVCSFYSERMARDLPDTDDENLAPSRAEQTDIGGNGRLLDRRNYLKLAGAAAAVGAFSAGSGAAAADGEYDVIELDPDERRVIRVGSGETFENVVFDQRAPGAAATISAMGTNWTVRNVAFRGAFGHRDRAFGVADTGGGTSRIENVYMGDGVESGVGDTRHPKFGLWVSPDHSGHLEISRMYVDGAHDNAFYGSAPGSNSNGQLGTVHFENCFAKDSWVSGFRIARGTVENCTAINTSSGRDGRPLWVWPTERHGDPVEIVDCNFVDGPYPLALDIGRDGRRTEIALRDTQWEGRISQRGSVSIDWRGGNGNDPNPSPPEGCPTSVGEVFEGVETGSGGSTVGEEYHTLELAGQFAYRVEVDGEIDPAPDHAEWLAEGEAYGDDWAEWWLSGSDDARTVWEFTGEIASLEIDDYDGETEIRTLAVDGESIDPDAL